MPRSRSHLRLSAPFLFPIGAAALCCLSAPGCGPYAPLDSTRGQVVTRTDDPDCPPGIPCDDVPAGYAVTDTKTGAYGNYDLANRERDGQEIRYIVIHTTEGSYDGTIGVFQDPKYSASAHYLIRSRDGHLAKFVSPDHVAWHAGNWYFNMHSVGIEHEAAAATGYGWFTDELYETSAALVRFLAGRYNIPLDRQHIIGHDEVPGLSQARTGAMHWDPGPYWDWDRFLRLVRARPGGPAGDRPDDDTESQGPIRIQPDYATNRPPLSDCTTTGGTTTCAEVLPRPTSFVYLREAPSESAPLIVNRYLTGTPADRMYNWGNKAGAGRLYYRIDRSGDWDAIWFGGQVGWFENPGRRSTRIPLLGGGQVVITPKTGGGPVAIYGGGYPGAAAYKPPTTPQTLEKVYDLPEGQRYVADGPYTADYYWAKVWAATLPMSSHQVVKDSTLYYSVSWNHRLALVRADSVTVLRPSRGHPAPLDELPTPTGSDTVAAPAASPSREMPLRELKGME